MGRNIVIFSDGTGNSSGIYLDENRTNIYKLYRATRIGPMSEINPAEQVAFYDAGVGTSLPNAGFFRSWFNRGFDLVGKLTGLGLTDNVVQCYAALIRLWEPGDRIFLFGFSRGAYTVRLLGGVISHCGIPTAPRDDPTFKRDSKTALKIAQEAVTEVYQYTHSVAKARNEREQQLLDVRATLAARFREKYGSEVDSHADLLPADYARRNRASNTAPHFIGVFDTVSSLEIGSVMWLLIAIWTGVIAVAAWPLAALTGYPWWGVFASLAACSAGYFGGWFLNSRLKFPGNVVTEPETGQRYPWWETMRLTLQPMKFNDYTLGKGVAVARHAMSVDERRKAFVSVPWKPEESDQISPDGQGKRVEQRYFAGVHADVGGGYPENGARLSDIALEWMAGEASRAGLKIDRSFLKPAPDPVGLQNDEAKSSVFRFSLFSKKWRDIKPTALLDPSVIARFEAGPVLHHDVMQPYRPESLRGHKDVARFYEAEAKGDAIS